jgi:glutamate decarboxylase
VPLEGDELVTDPERAAAACDENTIGVVSVLGSTFTGDYENVAALERGARPLAGDEDRARYSHPRGWRERRIRGAVLQPESGVGFPAAAREIHQHFRAQVRPGLSRAWAGSSGARPDLHPDLIFNVDYLGGTMPTLAINFSRPASQIVAQYYNLIRLGKSGYRAIHQACQDVAVEPGRQIGEMGRSRCSATGGTCRCSRGS